MAEVVRAGRMNGWAPSSAMACSAGAGRASACVRGARDGLSPEVGAHPHGHQGFERHGDAPARSHGPGSKDRPMKGLAIASLAAIPFGIVVAVVLVWLLER